jgi:hypothetical protein
LVSRGIAFFVLLKPGFALFEPAFSCGYSSHRVFHSALLRLNPLAPAVTRRTKSIAPAVTRRIELFEFRFASCKKFLLFSEFSCKM